MSGRRQEGPAQVRPATPGDGEAVRRVVGEAFGDEGSLVARLCAVLDEADHTRASLVAEVGAEVGAEDGAEDGGGVVGHVQLSRCWVDARHALVEVLVLSPLSVLPSHQRTGIGGQLVEAALTLASQGPWPARRSRWPCSRRTNRGCGADWSTATRSGRWTASGCVIPCWRRWRSGTKHRIDTVFE